jgi:RNA polymerase sigma-70 factor (ECF subfamily)
MDQAKGSDDAALVRAAQAGDRRALERLLELHHDRVYAVCRRMAGNDADARDATQEALLAIVRGLPKFDGRAALGTWVYRVATNACLDELRRRSRRPDPVDHRERVEARTAGTPGHDQQLVDRLAIDEALAALPDEFRAAVVLRDVGGLDYAEIAEVLAIPPGTVRSRIARGRAALARHLGNQETDASVPTEAP